MNRTMTKWIFQLAFKAARFSKKTLIYQTLIILLLAAIITGSLLTGYSVKESLRRSAAGKLGNTGVVISSGERFFDPSVAGRMTKTSGIASAGFLEIKGYCQLLSTQKKALNSTIFAIDSGFFRFQGFTPILINQGEVAINRKLADYLGAVTGDELIMHYRNPADVPAGAPFSPSRETDKMVVRKITRILEADESGNFSLSISQVVPMNIFMSLGDVEEEGQKSKINRLAFQNSGANMVDELSSILKKTIRPGDIGFRFRTISKTGETEIVSDRVFIDNEVIKELKEAVPASAPLLTYLGNSFKHGIRSTPYSFVATLPSTIYPEAPGGNNILINPWLAEDLSAAVGDSIQMTWFSPDSLNKLVEKKDKFLVTGIVKMEGIWADSLLMPAFPGIAGTKSCSDWDAGTLIKLNEIRKKDEDYWKKNGGTPKAFISYEKGKEIWGNNYGPATAIRIPAGSDISEIEDRLAGKIDPFKAGFTITDLYGDSLKAADESVDFGELFLSLGFFLIIASLILLSFTVTSFLESKSGELRTLNALGFKNRVIGRLLFLELAIMALPGSILGAFSGYFINVLITLALNSVWQGAVQTNTLKSFFSPSMIITGFVMTIVPVVILAVYKIRMFFRKTELREKVGNILHRSGKWRSAVIITALATAILFALSLYMHDQKVLLSFAAGTVLFIFMILFFRYLILSFASKIKPGSGSPEKLFYNYYSFYPSHAVMPVLFIAAGVFAVFVTGANRVDSDSSVLMASGGTGGYQLWCESSLPAMEDLNSATGRKEAGIDDPELEALTFVQAKRYAGDDASCLNLNHVAMPPLIGLDPARFINKGAFSFSGALKDPDLKNTWEFLNHTNRNNVIYGIADQTVLEWGLKIGIGDTLVVRAENGQPLRIIIAGGLKSSIFQGNIIVGMENFVKYFPSVSGSTVMLAEGKPEQAGYYKSVLSERFENKGLNIELTTDRLASFNEVTNTYLSVFMVLGALGMIIGIAGLGFVLLRNYNFRKREFALMLATGFTMGKIRMQIISEQIVLLLTGIATGVFSAVISTLPSITVGSEIPWITLLVMILAIALAGLAALFISVRSVTSGSLITVLRKD
jgi:putative ABC transport system permease protein